MSKEKMAKSQGNILKISEFKKKFNGQVLLGDSSNKEHFQATEKYIRKLDCEYEVNVPTLSSIGEILVVLI